MNIVIISSFDSGGAGVAALRLHKALLSKGENSHFLCFNQTSNIDNIVQINKPLHCKILEHLPLPFWNNKYKKIAPLINQDFECISFPESIDYLSNHPLIKNADIINLHWIGSNLSYKQFFRKVKKPIIWTLHDMNPFLGCAHFSRDIELYPKWRSIELKIRHKKEKWIHSAKHIEVVDLCTWMKKHSSESNVLGIYPHHIIRNSVDTNTFKSYPKQAARQLLDIPSNKPVLMFVSQNINNTRKGVDLLLSALKKLDDFYILIVGAASEDLNLGNNIKHLGYINDDRLMAILYASADAFLLPSREDNLPNTMVESLCCGTPVITMPNGGMTDIIRNGRNGYICKTITCDSLVATIKQFLKFGVSMSTSEISNEAHQLFSPFVQANHYLTVYKQAIENYDKDF